MKPKNLITQKRGANQRKLFVVFGATIAISLGIQIASAAGGSALYSNNENVLWKYRDRFWFINPGTAELTYSDGKKINFIISGTPAQADNLYKDFLANWTSVLNVSNKSDLEKVKAANAYIIKNFGYDGSNGNTIAMFYEKAGNCSGASNMLVDMCQSIGIEARSRAAKERGIGGLNGSTNAHQNCVIIINGQTYIADPTPPIDSYELPAFLKNSFWTLGEYKNKYAPLDETSGKL